MKSKFVSLLLTLLALTSMASVALADATIVPITMYEVRGTVEDRTGPHDGRSADYTGTVTQQGDGLWYYRGGVGSLNDGQTFEGINNGQQLFQEMAGTTGGINTAIDLYFGEDSYYSITGLRIYGGNPDTGDNLFNDTQTGSLTQLSISGFDYLTDTTVEALDQVTTPETEITSILSGSTFVDDYLDLSEYFGDVAV